MQGSAMSCIHVMSSVFTPRTNVQVLGLSFDLHSAATDSLCVLQLCDLYENDCIFDKFDCAISGSGQYVTTGSYNNFLKVTGRQGGPETIVEASRDPLRKRLQPQAKVQRPVSSPQPTNLCCSPASL